MLDSKSILQPRKVMNLAREILRIGGLGLGFRLYEVKILVSWVVVVARDL